MTKTDHQKEATETEIAKDPDHLARGAAAEIGTEADDLGGIATGTGRRSLGGMFVI